MRLALTLAVLLATSLQAVELTGPASVEAGSGELVRVVTADEVGDCLWSITPATLDSHVMRDSEGKPLGLLFAAPAVASEIDLVTVRCISWDTRTVDELAVVVTGAPEPDPEPEPGPTPPEPRPGELVVADTWLVIVFEADEQDPDNAVRSYELDNYLYDTFEERWRLWDDDLGDAELAKSTAPEILKEAYKRGRDFSRGQTWLVMTDGRTVVSEPLQGTPENAVAQIKGHLQ